jgi:hypothetical protein
MLSVGSYAEALSSIFVFVYGSVDILNLTESLNSYPESMAFLVRFRRKVNIPQCCCKRISHNRYLGLGFRRNVLGGGGEMTFCILCQLGVFLN